MEPPKTRPFAVVTGASGGIGYEIARLLGADGYDLLIAAEDSEIDGVRQELAEITDVDAIRVDLAKSDDVEMLHRRILEQDRPVDALVLSGGIGAGGAFANGTSLENELRLIDLNVRSTIHLCKLEIGPMVKRDRGRVLFTNSVASTKPGSHQAVFNASRYFVQTFALALRNELKDTGVSVTSLVSGSADGEEQDSGEGDSK